MSDYNIIDFKELKSLLEKLQFKQLHIHHTWKPAHRSFTGDNHINLQVAMKDFHVIVNGWDDIGQHFTLMPDGSWISGRSLRKDPASIRGWNKGALAIEMIGNFDIPGTGSYNILGHDKLEGDQRHQILALINYFGERFGYDKIVFHREGPNVNKTCPGTGLDKTKLLNEAKLIKTINHDISSWASDAIKWAIDNDLIDTINPRASMNLERTLTILYRFSKLNNKLNI